MLDLIAFIDCETTGLIVKDAPVTDQPHITQLACRMVTAEKEMVAEFSRIIKPDGWTIPEEVEKLTGITNDLAYQVGVDMWFALSELMITLRNATRIVGHGLQTFDRPMIAWEFERDETNPLQWHKLAPKFYDTMEAATPILKLPGQYGSYKWPSLQEAVQGFNLSFEARFDAAFVSHRANVDVRLTEEVYWAIQNRRDHADAA